MGRFVLKANFWPLQILVFFLCTFITFKYYSKAFPLVEMDIKMNREEALKAAAQLAHKYSWGPKNFRQSVIFDLDSKTQTFVELSAGTSFKGYEAFLLILKKKLY